MQLEAAGLSDVGLRRENNQDYFLIDQDLGVYIVADGMGGHRGGEVASKMAAETIREVIKANSQDKNVRPHELLQRAYQEACRVIYNESRAVPELEGMGTTAVTILQRDDMLYIGNVGDSRAYLIKNPNIWQITDDHSLLNEQLRAGIIKNFDPSQFAAKNVITRSVGFEEVVVCDVIERKLQPEEMILVCSDGLSGLVPDQRICDICLSMPVSDAVPTLIEEAKKAGGDDNVTTILLKTKS